MLGAIDKWVKILFFSKGIGVTLQ